MVSDAVIFIPGIKGTKLVETNRTPFDTIWSGLQSNFESLEDLELSRGDSRVYYDERVDFVVQPGEIEELAYREFLRDLATDKPVFIFNYDWRYSAAESGDLFKQFLDYLIAKSKASAGIETFRSFDVITHSLGNSVLRNYMHNHGMQRIGKIVFTVPPFKGSLDIVSVVLVGEGFFSGVRARFRKVVRTMPGALELLPTYRHASRFEPSGPHSFFNFNQWQGNIIGPEPLAQKMKQALADAKAVVNEELQDLSKLKRDERDRILVVARHGYPTYQAVKVLKQGPGDLKNFVELEDSCRTDHGDGRVPHASSCIYHDSISTLMLDDASFYQDYSHGFVLRDERAQKLVNRFLFRSKPFRWDIPGGSIRKVTGLKMVKDAARELNHWEAVF